MKDIQIAVETELSQIVNSLLAGQSIPLTAMLFHPNEYRVLKANNSSLLTITQAYLADASVRAYGLIFEGYYEGDTLDGASDCLTSVVVTRDGHARVEHIPFVRHGKQVEIHETRIAIIDEPFLRLFEPFPTEKYNMDAVEKALADARTVPAKAYSDFIVASIGL